MFHRVFFNFVKNTPTRTGVLEFHSLFDQKFVPWSKEKFSLIRVSGTSWKSFQRKISDDQSKQEVNVVPEKNETSRDTFIPQDNILKQNASETIANENNLPSNYVFMRGLPYSATKNDIIQFFSPLGISPVKVTLKCDRFGFTNGKAEVEFETAEESSKALQKQNHYIGSRYIELSLDPFPQMSAERPTFRNPDGFRQNPFAKDSPRHVVKLSGIPFSANSNDISKFFEPLNIMPVGIELKYTPDGYPLGICFVTFKSHVDAMDALKNNNKYMGNRYVRITLAGGAPGRSQYSGVIYDDKIDIGESRG